MSSDGQKIFLKPKTGVRLWWTGDLLASISWNKHKETGWSDGKSEPYYKIKVENQTLKKHLNNRNKHVHNLLQKMLFGSS